MTRTEPYTSKLGAGLGLPEETRILLALWRPSMDSAQLCQAALASGRFPNVTARRLRNIVAECFAPRYLVQDAVPAKVLQALQTRLPSAEFSQLLFLYTCRANLILADFVRDIYWRRYAGGATAVTNQEAQAFVTQATHGGRTEAPWSDSTIQNVAGYLTGCCADYGLLEAGQRRVRRILPFRLGSGAAAVLAYDLHFAGLGDNAVLGHAEWGLFGLEPGEVRDEFRRLSLRGYLVLQTAGDLVRVGWPLKTWEDLIHVLSQG